MKNSSRSRLLLLELVFDLVIFGVCAAVCVAILVSARSMSRTSSELTDAVYLAQTAAEEWRATGAFSPPSGGYELQSADQDGGLVITVLKDGRTVYTLTVGGDAS